MKHQHRIKSFVISMITSVILTSLGANEINDETLHHDIVKNASHSNNIEYSWRSVVGPDGKIWMDRNVGAQRVARYFNDGPPSINNEIQDDGDGSVSYGAKFKWVDAIKSDTCPIGYGLPSKYEWDRLSESIQSKEEYAASSSTLKLPAAGFMLKHAYGTHGMYWSSIETSDYLATALVFSKYFMGTAKYRNKIDELAVRCIKQNISTIKNVSSLKDKNKTYIWKDVKGPDGKIWMDRNVGAKRVAEAYNDGPNNDDENGSGSYGFKFTWAQAIKLDTCPKGHRLPTKDEWIKLVNTLVKKYNSLYLSTLKLPSSGLSSSLNGKDGNYWSSSQNDFYSAYNLMFTSNYINALNNTQVVDKMPVRCIKRKTLPGLYVLTDRISAYAKDDDGIVTAPTLQDYLDANLTDVDATNLKIVNDVISADGGVIKKPNEVNMRKYFQDIIDKTIGSYQRIIAYIVNKNHTTPTVEDYNNIGIKKGDVNNYNLNAINSDILSEDVKTIKQINDIIQKIKINHLSPNPKLIGSLDTNANTVSITLSKDSTKAYTVNGYKGLQIIDISNPHNPIFLGSYNTRGYAKGIVLSNDGTKAYIADGLGLNIIDISNPNNPTHLGTLAINGTAYRIKLSKDGSKVYIASGYKGISIVDVSYPSNPILLGSFATNGYNARGIALSNDGTKAYLTDGKGLKIIDISYPSDLVLIGSLDTNGKACGITLSSDGTKAYLVDGKGLRIIDITYPDKPIFLGSYDTNGMAYGITLSNDGETVYISDFSKGLKLINISNPRNPTLIDSIDTNGLAVDVTLSYYGRKAYIANGEKGLAIIDLYYEEE